MAERFIPSPGFEAARAKVLANFFARDPSRYSLFAAEPVRGVVAYQRERHERGAPGVLRAVDEDTHEASADAAGLPKGLRGIAELANSPAGLVAAGQGPARAEAVAQAMATMASVTSSPRYCHNVVGPASDPSIVGAAIGSVVNANLVDHEYSGAVTELEQSVVRTLATLLGFAEPERAAGVFTSGGTMANTYGLLAGVRRAFPGSARHGLAAAKGRPMRVVSSAAGHYSNVTAMTTVGLDPATQGLRVDINDRNEMCVSCLREQLAACSRDGVAVPSILLTMGTTDTFAVDDAAAVADAVDEACAADPSFGRPHVHVDAAVGWPAALMSRYDCAANADGLSPAALDAAAELGSRFAGLCRVDSVTVDLHKWGLVSYPSSCVIFRDPASLRAFASSSELYSYFESSLEAGEGTGAFGVEMPTVVATASTHAATAERAAPGGDPEAPRPLHELTLECSRAATGVFAAQMHLQSLGEEGMRLCVGASLHTAALARHLLSTHPAISGRVRVVRSVGPSVAFRLLPPGMDHEEEDGSVAVAHAALCEMEQDGGDEAAAARALEGALRAVGRATGYHHSVYRRREARRDIAARGLRTSWVGQVSHSAITPRHARIDLAGEKAVFFNPGTTDAMVGEWVEAVVSADAEAAAEWEAEVGGKAATA